VKLKILHSRNQKIQINIYTYFLPTSLCLFFAQQPTTWPGLLIHEVSRLHTKTHHNRVGLLWTSDRLVTETATCQHTTLTTDRHPCRRWDSKPQSQQASVQTYGFDRAATATGPLMCVMPSNAKSDLIKFAANTFEDSIQRYFYKIS
jgi:hypothetical protein